MRQDSTGRRALAFAFGAIVLLSACGGGLETDKTTRDASGAITEAGELGAGALQVGDCYLLGEAESQIDTVDGVPCTTAHDFEVFAVFDLPDGDFPGNEGVSDAAGEQCLEAFESYVGLAYSQSVFEGATIAPTEQTWGNGDREVICSLSDPSGQMSESARNTGR